MPKSWTPEQRQAAGERLRAARVAKKAKIEADLEAEAQAEIKQIESEEPSSEEPSGYKSTDPDLDTVAEWQIGAGRNQLLEATVLSLQKQVEELLADRRLERASEATKRSSDRETPAFGSQGDLIGSFERYITDAAFYPDPRERLSQEPRLQRFAFPLNYELNWAVSTTQYETIDNRRVKEPRFTVELVRIILDEDTGEPTSKRYVICRGIFHEDPEAAIEIAGRNGVVVDNSNQKAFLDEMRYLRMRDWLLEAFYPPKPSPQQNKRETVIGNKLVEVYEVSNEVGEATPKIPYGDLDRKL